MNSTFWSFLFLAVSLNNEDHFERPYCYPHVKDELQEEGAISGIVYFFTSEIGRLFHSAVWVDAVIFGIVVFSIIAFIHYCF